MYEEDQQEKAEQGKFPDIRRHAAQKCERRVAQDREHEGANAAKAVGERTPQKCAAPADEKDRE